MNLVADDFLLTEFIIDYNINKLSKLYRTDYRSCSQFVNIGRVRSLPAIEKNYKFTRNYRYLTIITGNCLCYITVITARSVISNYDFEP